MNRSSLRARRVVAMLLVGAATATVPALIPIAPVYADAPSTILGLAAGDRGQGVRAVQQALVDAGMHVEGGVDGIFGPGTNAAVKEFQKIKGLPVTGTVDEATAVALGLSEAEADSADTETLSDDVRMVQEVLIKYGYTVVGGADGVFGPNTATPLKVFQGHNGLEATGEINGATLNLAKALLDIGADDVAVDTTSASQADRTDEVEIEIEAADQNADEAAAEDAPEAADSMADQIVGLRMGSSGDSVKSVQQILIDAGYDVVGGADGVFGALTANAVKAFQADVGLAADGIVGPKTSQALADEARAAENGPTGVQAPVESPLKGLAYGSVGDNVKALQQLIIDAGFNLFGGADGVFGTATRDALVEWQKSAGVEPSGKVDDATADALRGTAEADADAPASGGSNETIVGLKAGELGSLVKQLQDALIEAGVSLSGGSDGIFGPATDQALRDFQKSQGLDVTGVVDQATLDALSEPQAAEDATADAVGFAAYGERGDRVRSLQQALVDAGITLRGGVDGDFGTATSSAIMEFQSLNGLSVTGKVNDATASALGLSESAPSAGQEPVPQVQIDVFPVQGWCGFADTWHAERSGGRLHIGTDVIAAEGKLLYAVADGVVDKVYYDQPGSLAGNGIRLRLPDGTYFFYAHMVGVAEGIEEGAEVKAGQIVGAVGSTGNAGTAHLHFEIHPGGGAAINPYPILKQIDGCDNKEPLPQP